MAELLVSVRSAEEALAALAGGAAIIDIKEPANGALGRARDSVIADVIRQVAGARPVSAAFGELVAGPAAYGGAGLRYAKWGLAACGREIDWQTAIRTMAHQWAGEMPGCQGVAVAYADWHRAAAPRVEAVADFVKRQQWPILLVDTWCKDGTNLLDWLPLAQVVQLCDDCRSSGVQVALAGALGIAEIERLLPANPQWFAVRTAACDEGKRDRAVSCERVQRIVDLLSRCQSLHD